MPRLRAVVADVAVLVSAAGAAAAAVTLTGRGDPALVRTGPTIAALTAGYRLTGPGQPGAAILAGVSCTSPRACTMVGVDGDARALRRPPPANRRPDRPPAARR